MLTQLFVGSVITFISLVGGAVLWWSLIEVLERVEPWLQNPPLPVKSLFVILMVVVTTMMMMASGVWLWALYFAKMEAFSSLEEAVYYSLVAYTTLGVGDVAVPIDQRLLAGMTGANGFLMFGLMTAILTDSLRYVRGVQRDAKIRLKQS